MDNDIAIGRLPDDKPDAGKGAPRDFIHQYHADLTKWVVQVLGTGSNIDQDQLIELGKHWLEACARGNPDTVRIFIDGGMYVNFCHPVTGLSALVAAAQTGAREAARVLIACGQCDYLLRDYQGRLASECAYVLAEDVALARLLGNKERKQAAAQGITLTRRP